MPLTGPQAPAVLRGPQDPVSGASAGTDLGEGGALRRGVGRMERGQGELGGVPRRSGLRRLVCAWQRSLPSPRCETFDLA